MSVNQLEKQDRPHGTERKTKAAGWFSCLLALVRLEILASFRRRKILGLLVIAIMVDSLVWIPWQIPFLEQLPKAPYPLALEALRYDFVFGGSIGFIGFALFIAMDSISGEFEHGTIVTLLTKPVTKGMIYFGKFLGALSVLLVVFAVKLLNDVIWSTVFYGPQNDLTLQLVYLAGLLFNAVIFLSIVFGFASLTRSTIMTAMLSLGYYIVDQAVQTLKLPLAEFIPGYGIGLTTPSVASGTAGLGPLVAFYLQNGNIILQQGVLGSVHVLSLISEGFVVGLVWIAVFFPFGLFSFRRPENE